MTKQFDIKPSENLPQLMIIPSLGCQANCSYCFGPNKGPVMSLEQLEKTLAAIFRLGGQVNSRQVKILFHGGEPLLAGYRFFETALARLSRHFGPGKISFAIQSNLWLMDDSLARLFKQYSVRVGTSLDGPRQITDAQRGKGYFEKTYRGIEVARSNGIPVGAIVTITDKNQDFWPEIFRFFKEKHIGINIHAAIGAHRRTESSYYLDPHKYGQLLCEMLDFYIEHRKEMSIPFFDQLIRGVAFRSGQVCTFKNCEGMFLVFDPIGNLYPCQRFCGDQTFCLGNLNQKKMIQPRLPERIYKVAAECAKCVHLSYCKGGCLYNRHSTGSGKDLFCESYRQIFNHILKQLHLEMNTDSNISAMAGFPCHTGHNPVLKRGPMIELARHDTHPVQIVRVAKKIVAALNHGQSLGQTACDDVSENKVVVNCMPDVYKVKPPAHVYLHLNRRYPRDSMPLSVLEKSSEFKSGAIDEKSRYEIDRQNLRDILAQLKHIDLEHVIVTGHNPFSNKLMPVLEREMCDFRSDRAETKFTILTHIKNCDSDTDLSKCFALFDYILLGIEVSKLDRDALQGTTSYANVIESLNKVSSKISDSELNQKLVLFPLVYDDITSEDLCHMMNRIGHRIGKLNGQFRIDLPIDTKRTIKKMSIPMISCCDPYELICEGFLPSAMCRWGQDLHIEPDASVFRCDFLHAAETYVGNLRHHSILEILDRYHAMVANTSDGCLWVDTKETCKKCEYKYLCGGKCTYANRIEPPGKSIHAAFPDCKRLTFFIRGIVKHAREYIGTCQSTWGGLYVKVD